MKKRVLSLLLALAMVLSLLPVTVFAVDGHDGQVRVRVENSTWNKADGAPWEGTLVDEWITLKDDSTMMSCVKYALEKNNYSYETASSIYGGEYLGKVNGLAEVDGGAQSGWMGTLNDWFVNASFSAFTAKNGTLAAGDEIRVLYTKTGYGADIGGDWSTKSNTALSALSFSSGTLSPAFDKDTLEYTLTLTEPANVTVAVTAANKCNQVYLTVGETSYRRSASIPMEDGTVLTLRCGDAEEGTENTPRSRSHDLYRHREGRLAHPQGQCDRSLAGGWRLSARDRDCGGFRRSGRELRLYRQRRGCFRVGRAGQSA